MRALTLAAAIVLLVIHEVAAAQPPAAADTRRDTRFSIQAGGGPTLRDGGSVASAAFGFSPVSRVELAFNVERIHLPFQLEQFPGGSSATRGGTLTFASGEVRVAALQPDRLSPFAIAGVGRGVSRPTVNDMFPDAVRNDLGVVYFGGGLRVPLRGGVSVVGDVRALLAIEESDSLMTAWPVRIGVAWRF